MKIIECNENNFRNDFMPMIIDLWCCDKFNPQNPQHVEWLDKRIHAAFIDFSTALCAYTDNNEPIGYLWYKHDTGMEGVSFSGKDAHIIQLGLFDNYQRQGIGSKLLEEACKRIKNNGGECLYTDTYADNDDSTIFYIKKKFIPVAYHPGEDGINDLGQVYFYKVL
jgi:ribosomal protein S18 acetylase RimI-like enzyme